MQQSQPGPTQPEQGAQGGTQWECSVRGSLAPWNPLADSAPASPLGQVQKPVLEATLPGDGQRARGGLLPLIGTGDHHGVTESLPLPAAASSIGRGTREKGC